MKLYKSNLREQQQQQQQKLSAIGEGPPMIKVAPSMLLPALIHPIDAFFHHVLVLSPTISNNHWGYHGICVGTSQITIWEITDSKPLQSMIFNWGWDVYLWHLSPVTYGTTSGDFLWQSLANYLLMVPPSLICGDSIKPTANDCSLASPTHPS